MSKLSDKNTTTKNAITDNSDAADVNYSGSATAVTNRRSLLKRSSMIGASTAMGLFVCSADGNEEEGDVKQLSCILSPKQTEGPYYLNLNRVRQNITEGKSGVPLNLLMTIVDAGSCEPIEGAIVDIWHCDAEGEYSGYDSSRPLRGGHMEPDSEQVFLRGVQVSDAKGLVRFQTIFPGCYTSRTTHIHAKVYLNEHELVTTQMYFPDAVTERVYKDSRYRGDRNTTNKNDYLMRRSKGLAMLDMVADTEGYTGLLTIGVNSINGKRMDGKRT